MLTLGTLSSLCLCLIAWIGLFREFYQVVRIFWVVSHVVGLSLTYYMPLALFLFTVVYLAIVRWFVVVYLPKVFSVCLTHSLNSVILFSF